MARVLREEVKTMITLTDQDMKEIRERLERVWDIGYKDKTVTLIESVAALVSIETILDMIERREKQKPEHEAQAIA